MIGKRLSAAAGMGVAVLAAALAAGCTTGHAAPSRTASAAVRQPAGEADGQPAAGHSAAGQSTVEHWGVFFGGSGGFLDLHTTPVAVTVPGIVQEVGTSNSTEYALLTNGSLYAWGVGTQGQLGDGQDVNSFETPVLVQFPRGVKIAYVATDAMPYDSALAVDTHGNAWAWGVNTGGEFCLGNQKDYSTPVRLPFTDVTTLAGADAHALYDAEYHGDKTVWACGDNMRGDLGDGDVAASTTPVAVSGVGDAPVSAVVASFDNSGVLLSSGRYLDWGYNADGQLGDGQSGGYSDVPLAVTLPGAVVQVALGGSIWHNGQTLVLLRNGTVWTWGADWAGQLDNGVQGTGPDPVAVRLPAGTVVQGLATGSGTSYVMTTTGLVYAWGANYAGQVGNGSTKLTASPVKVASGATQISSTANNALINVPSGTA
jgi:alpha-tubulin suppressor-like RCC1 family protein